MAKNIKKPRFHEEDEKITRGALSRLQSREQEERREPLVPRPGRRSSRLRVGGRTRKAA